MAIRSRLLARRLRHPSRRRQGVDSFSGTPPWPAPPQPRALASRQSARHERHPDRRRRRPEGFPEAITAFFPDTAVRPCIVQLIRDSTPVLRQNLRHARMPLAAERDAAFNSTTRGFFGAQAVMQRAHPAPELIHQTEEKPTMLSRPPSFPLLKTRPSCNQSLASKRGELYGQHYGLGGQPRPSNWR